MTKNTMQECWHHPNRVATHTVLAFGLSTPLCDICTELIKNRKQDSDAIIVPITKDIYDRNDQ